MVWNVFGERSQLGSKNPANAVVASVGLLLIAIGTYSPWLTNNPDYTGNGLVLMPQLTSGFSIWDLASFLAIVVALLAIAVRGFSVITGGVLLITGVGVTVLPTILLISLYIEPNPVYIADVGAVFTILGGLCLVGIGARVLYQQTRGDPFSPLKTETDHHR